jgi:cerevisin
MKLLTLTALVALASSATPILALPASSLVFIPGQQAPYVSEPARIEEATNAPGQVPSSYIVVLKNGIDATSFLAHQQLISAAQMSATAFHSLDQGEGHGIRHVYDLANALQGYSGKFTDDVLEFIRAQPEVEYVEKDSIVKTQELPHDGRMVWDSEYPSTGNHATGKVASSDPHDVEKGAPWVSVVVCLRCFITLLTVSTLVFSFVRVLLVSVSLTIA